MTDAERAAYYFLVRLLFWRSELERLDNEAVERIVSVLAASKADIRKRLAAEAAGLASITDWNRERMQALDKWCDEVLAGANATLGATISEASVIAATTSIATYNAMLSFEGAAKAVRQVNMTPEQIPAWFRDTPLGGGTLQQWVDRSFSNGVKESILGALRQSGIEGKGTAASVRRLLDTALDQGFSITEREAITLTRTYIQTANVEAQRAVYDANDDIVYGDEWCAVLDNRVCRLCASLDGTKYKRGEPKPPIPRHPRCRCLLRPLVHIPALGITSEDLGRVTRRWIIREPGAIGAGGRRKILEAGTTKENFSGWWETLPYEEQIKSIGAVRTRLINDGKLSWSDLVDKSTGRYYTLEELGFTEQGGEIKK